jgi:prepilin-type N-terminal cleavage/methylation domain-containing protein
MKTKRGFTLLELLMTIAILGALATFVIIRLTGSEKGARDTRRRSDIRQYQTIIEAYKSNHDGYFPSRTNVKNISVLCGDFSLSSCPDDSLNPMATYRYVTNGTGSASVTATDYVLWAKLEKPTIDTWFVACSNGQVGEVTAEPSSYNCPL